MTDIIRRSTTSSPAKSLASNLQLTIVLLKLARAGLMPTDVGWMSPDTKKVCKDMKAAEVIGPVEREDRINARNGLRRAVKGSFMTSSRLMCILECVKHDPKLTLYIPDFSLQFLKACHEVDILSIMTMTYRIRHICPS